MPVVYSRASQPRVRQWKVRWGHVSRFQSGGSGDDDVNVQVHFDVADVDAPRADAVVVTFQLISMLTVHLVSTPVSMSVSMSTC